MLRRLFCGLVLAAALPALLLASPSLLLAQSGQSAGQWSSQTLDEEATELADGRTVIMGHAAQATFADDADHPLASQRAECASQTVLSADGEVMSGNGTCFSRDADGDGLSYWWVIDSVGTEDCPDLCGSFTYYGGYGKYAGTTGGGTWRRTALVGGMGMGTWSGSYSIP